MREYAHSLTIAAPSAAVLDAFFNHDALAAWWRVSRSLCVPRPLGSYALEWEPTEYRDEVLGRLGGAFRGTVIEYKSGREFFVADTHWLPPDGPPIGPMAFEVTCSPLPTGTVLQVRHSGGDDGPRWRRYYEILGTGMTVSLENLKNYLEAKWR